MNDPFSFPVLSFLGGIIIGVSAIVLLLFKGRIAGISGIINHFFSLQSSEYYWRGFFLLGLVIGPLFLIPFDFVLPQTIDIEWSILIIGAFLVGLGSNFGSGCTSGHGICGIGRFSLRSIVATITFMSVAVLTVFVVSTIK
jgi:uncharacterized membrane protein YedE/YeeE